MLFLIHIDQKVIKHWRSLFVFEGKCADLSTLDGGSFELTTNGLQSTVSYNCNVGYTLDGTYSMTCLTTGIWNDTEPGCGESVGAL